jgi:hypothetical protein
MRLQKGTPVKKSTVIVVLIVLVCGLALVGGALAANGFAIRRSVIGGGGQKATGGEYVLDGTLGEPIAGELHVGPTYGLRPGYWHPGQAWTVYLPIVLRQAQ